MLNGGTLRTMCGMPADWRNLGMAHTAPSQSFYTARDTSRPPGPADYPALEVWDTSELDAFEDQLKAERERLGEVFRIAKEEKRKVIWKNAQFDLKKVDRIEGWIREIRKDTRRTW